MPGAPGVSVEQQGAEMVVARHLLGLSLAAWLLRAEQPAGICNLSQETRISSSAMHKKNKHQGKACVVPTELVEVARGAETHCERAVAAAAAAAAGCRRALVLGILLMMTLVLRGTAWLSSLNSAAAHRPCRQDNVGVVHDKWGKTITAVSR